MKQLIIINRNDNYIQKFELKGNEKLDINEINISLDKYILDLDENIRNKFISFDKENSKDN